MKMTKKEYENRALWYALFLSIVKNLSTDDSLRIMGE